MKAFTVLFLAHVLGDYLLQPEALAQRKAKGMGWVLLHTLIYAAACFSTLLLLGGGYIWAVTAAAGSHLLIDVLKKLIVGVIKTPSADRAVFCTDQALHLICILAASIWVTSCFDIAVPPYMKAFSGIVGMEAYKLIGYIAAGLALMKPANVFVRKMLLEGKTGGRLSSRNEDAARIARTGRYIGGLERLLMLALLALAQYGSIAIVFTAKSIARFKQLEDRDFAEYYLFGTLLSAVTAVGVFGIMKLFGTI